MSNTGDRFTHCGIEVVYVSMDDSGKTSCQDCPFVGSSSLPAMCHKAPCYEGFLLTVPDYVKWKLTK